MILTMGLNTPQRLICMGLDNPHTYSSYMGEHIVEQTLPQQFKDAYKLVVGTRQKSHHYPAWKTADVVAKKPHIERWMGNTEVLLDDIVSVFPKQHTPYMRQYLYTAFAEKLTQAYYALDEGDTDKAQQLINELISITEEATKLMKKPYIDALYEIKLYPDTRKYTASCVTYTTP